jgi:hypothetical protein
MLRDGRFIREAPPQIGKFYTPSKERLYTREEILAQNMLLSNTERRSLLKFIGKLLHK